MCGWIYHARDAGLVSMPLALSRSAVPYAYNLTVGGHSSYCWGRGRPSSARWVSPRLHLDEGDPVNQWGCWGLRRNRPESKSLGCAFDCVSLSCRAAVSLRGSPGPWPPRPVPSKSPLFDGEQPPSPAAASPSGSVPVRNEAWLRRRTTRHVQFKRRSVSVISRFLSTPATTLWHEGPERSYDVENMRPRWPRQWSEHMDV